MATNKIIKKSGKGELFYSGSTLTMADRFSVQTYEADIVDATVSIAKYKRLKGRIERSPEGYRYIPSEEYTRFRADYKKKLFTEVEVRARKQNHFSQKRSK